MSPSTVEGRRHSEWEDRTLSPCWPLSRWSRMRLSCLLGPQSLSSFVTSPQPSWVGIRNRTDVPVGMYENTHCKVYTEALTCWERHENTLLAVQSASLKRTKITYKKLKIEELEAEHWVSFYRRPLSNMGLNCAGPRICRLFFNKLLSCFPFMAGSQRLQRADCVYTILYTGLERPWILVSAGVLEPIPHGHQGAIKFVRVQSYMQVFDCTRYQGPKPPQCSRVNCMLYLSEMKIEKRTLWSKWLRNTTACDHRCTLHPEERSCEKICFCGGREGEMLQRMEQPLYGAEGLWGAREESEAGKRRERSGKIRGLGLEPWGEPGWCRRQWWDMAEHPERGWRGEYLPGVETYEVSSLFAGSRPHQSTPFKNDLLHAALGVMLILEAFKKSYSLQIIYNHTHLLERLNPFFKKWILLSKITSAHRRV